ncbi:hypothetical protein AJ80_00035 [Polytolypa hystricis UAMH7299]|uniref:ZIP Zinc transporter n=1 Tax=Polytolypa hystricis (strain UAMH7299) TaxID=1447883 RepID=A0A2B7Z3G2_POLH7|nr:hypothetical protein AJ80_00035 [Polytolypa hystricis UAMH7299]
MARSRVAMFLTTVPLFLFLLVSTSSFAASQELSACHRHGDVEYCVGPNGEDTPVSTHASAPSTSMAPATASATITSAPQTTAVTACHLHGSTTFCIDGDGHEVQVTGTGTPTSNPPAQFTSCHSHGADQYCVGPNGDGVRVLAAAEPTSTSHEGEHEDEHKDEQPGENCHFHAGVEHCVNEGQSEGGGSSQPSCARRDRDYNIPYRIGSLFAILVTSAIAVFGPILYVRFFSAKLNGVIFTIIKQFGTGIMLSTALIHLFTHAYLMFGSECLGTLEYEATTAAIVLAGIVMSFMIEYLGNRFILSRASGIACHTADDAEPQNRADKGTAEAGVDAQCLSLTNLGHHHHNLVNPDDKLSVMVMECGIVFHSVIIGLTLVVAGDSAYTSLFIVIIFHQMFEGLALGARIASLKLVKTSTKLILASIFAVITPIGMAVGLGVIHKFNGNDRSTIIAIGTLDALSAGILIWASMIDMLSHDWMQGDLRDAGVMRVIVGFTSLVAGMVLMGVLGKWA